MLTLTVLAVLAALTKEEVGLALAVLGVWIVVRGGLGRRYGAVLAAAVARLGRVRRARWSSPTSTRARARRSSTATRASARTAAGVTRTLVTRPWEALDQLGSYDRISYLVALLAAAAVPLARRAPARGRRPARDADQRPRRLVPAVLDRVPVRGRRVPFLVAAADPRPRRASAAAARPAWLARLLERDARGRRRLGRRGRCSPGVYLGPLPWWGGIPASARTSAPSSTASAPTPPPSPARSRMIPDGVPVSAGNLLAAHLSERGASTPSRSSATPQWVLVDVKRPYVGDRTSPRATPPRWRRCATGRTCAW